MWSYVRGIAIVVLGFACALGAQAGPAMFDASFIIQGWGNDVTSGTVFPYNTAYLTRAVPLGHDCQSFYPYGPNGTPNPRYCTASVFRNGAPATGSGTLSTGTAMGTPASIMMPLSAFRITTTGFLPTYYPYLQSWTYATVYNAPGTFFAGGGPAFGLGSVIHSGMGQRAGTFIIHEGKNAFGGVMGLLGQIGAKFKAVVPGKAGTWTGIGVGGTLPPMGRPQYATPIGYTAMGKTIWQNPFTDTGMFTNNLDGAMSTYFAIHTATPWTTGSVSLYVLAGYFQTILHRAGHDTVTSGGVRNLQLVTPAVVHWLSPGATNHSGHIGILTMQIVPEARSLLLLAAGGGILALLYRAAHRRR